MNSLKITSTKELRAYRMEGNKEDIKLLLNKLSGKFFRNNADEIYTWLSWNCLPELKYTAAVLMSKKLEYHKIGDHNIWSKIRRDLEKFKDQRVLRLLKSNKPTPKTDHLRSFMGRVPPRGITSWSFPGGISRC